MKHIIKDNGDECWMWEKGYSHREDDGPSVIWSSGSEAWYRNKIPQGQNYIFIINTNGKENSY